MDMMEMPMQAPYKVWRRGNIVYFSDDCEAEPLFKLKEHLMDISMDRRNPYAGIVINSYGGNADSIAFYDWLKAYPIPLVTFVEGVCFSAATTIFLAGSQRLMSPSSIFLIHSTHGMVVDDLNEGTARDTYEFTKSINATMRKIYMSETKLTKEQLDDMMAYRDKALTAKECVKYGIAHKVMVYMEGITG